MQEQCVSLLHSWNPLNWARPIAPGAAQPIGPGSTGLGLVISIAMWSIVLVLFIWFGGLIHIDGDGRRIAWSEIATTRAPVNEGIVLAQYWGKTLGVGPYDGVLLAAVRCLSIGIAAAGSIVLMRWVVVPLVWKDAFTGSTRANARACANVMCARFIAVLTVKWMFLTSCVFLMAAILPAEAIVALQLVGRVGVGTILLLGPGVWLARHMRIARGVTGYVAPQHTALFAAVLQVLCSTAVVIALVLLGAMATL